MRILVHDYCGHPFQIELGRWLAANGHDVLHLYSREIESPRGALSPHLEDPASLTIEGVSLGQITAKYSPLRRLHQEMAYARHAARRLRAFQPHAVLSGNCTAIIQQGLLRAARGSGAAFLYWLQDIYSDGVDRALAHRFGVAGRLAASVHRRLEFRTLAASDGVIAITPDFRTILTEGGVAPERIRVIENWAASVSPHASGAAWRREHGLSGRFVLLYAGTLGLKHDPGLLLDLARQYRDDPKVAVVVVSQGLGREFLETARRREGLGNLVLLDFQPVERLPEVHAAADVLLAVLEPYAGALSVPSKVLSYLRAGRPILAAVPPSNLAARTLLEAEAGLVVAPDDFTAAAERLYRDSALRAKLAEGGAAYARDRFNIAAKGQAFLEAIEAARRGL